MRRTRTAGTRITTECGHSWKSRYIRYTAHEMHEASTDCRVCGALLIIIIIPAAMPRNAVPAQVHCLLFHSWLHRQSNGVWPIDGKGGWVASF